MNRPECLSVRLVAKYGNYYPGAPKAGTGRRGLSMVWTGYTGGSGTTGESVLIDSSPNIGGCVVLFHDESKHYVQPRSSGAETGYAVNLGIVYRAAFSECVGRYPTVVERKRARHAAGSPAINRQNR